MVKHAAAARLTESGYVAVGLDHFARADDEIASRVDLDATFDLTSYTRHVDTVFGSSISRLRTCWRIMSASIAGSISTTA